MKLYISSKERSSDLFQKGVAFAKGTSSIVEPIPDQRFWKGMLSVALGDPYHKLWVKLADLHSRGLLAEDLIAFLAPLCDELADIFLMREQAGTTPATLGPEFEDEFKWVRKPVRPIRARALNLNFVTS